MRLLPVLITACLAVLCAGQAVAEARNTWPIETRFGFSSDTDERLSSWIPVPMNFGGRFQTWSLMGEPVVNCSLIWENPKADYYVVKAENAARDVTTAVEPGELEVYNVIVAGQVAWPDGLKLDRVFSASLLVVFCDAGIIAQNGEAGFNVAGSPNWDEFICSSNRTIPLIPVTGENRADHCRALGGQWLNKAEAQSVVRAGVDFTGFSILRADLNASRAVRRVEKQLWREASARFKEERAEALYSSLTRSGSPDLYAWSMRYAGELPILPRENPTTQQLDAYERAYQAVVAGVPEGLTGIAEAHADEWAGQEAELVAHQLDHIRRVDAGVAARQKAAADYRAALEERARNAPEPPEAVEPARRRQPPPAPIVLTRTCYKLGQEVPCGR